MILPIEQMVTLGTVRFGGAATRVLRLCLHPVLSNQYHQVGRLNSNYAHTHLMLPYTKGS